MTSDRDTPLEISQVPSGNEVPLRSTGSPSTSASVAPPRLDLDPKALIRNRVDAYVLAVVWILRKSFFPLLLFGIIVAGAYIILIDHDSATFVDRMNEMAENGNLLQNILSPFVLVAIALFARLALGIVALGAAFPLALHESPHDRSGSIRFSRFMRTWWNRWKLAQAFRAMRWTWPVRNEVLDQIDGKGTIWQWWDVVAIVLNIVLVIGVFIVLGIAGSQLPQP